MKKSILLPTVVIVGALSSLLLFYRGQLFGPVAPKPEDYLILTIGTADRGGTMYPVGNEIAAALSSGEQAIKVNIGASSGSSSNVEGLRQGQIDLGLVSGDVALCAYRGTDEFENNAFSDLRVIAALYSSMSNWMVLDTTDIEYVNQLKGLRLVVGPQSSSSELSARTALEVLLIDGSNSTLENQGLGSGSLSLQQRTVDAVHGFAGIPVSSLEELANRIPSRLLLYTEEELSQIVRKNPSYTRMVIPAGTYKGQDEDVQTFGVKCLLCVDASMDEELVYAITEALVKAIPQMAAENPAMAEMENTDFLFERVGVPLHPGALRYYEEAGLKSTK